MSKPFDVTTLNASRDPSDDQAGLRPPIDCGRSVLSSPVCGSTAKSSGEPLRVVANPIREPSGDHCGLSSSPLLEVAQGGFNRVHPGLDRRKNREYVRVVPTCDQARRPGRGSQSARRCAGGEVEPPGPR